ncbi:ABC transporter permease [Mameliella alba]|nr:ABC transporter permease [Mameliella sediminis]MBY6116938.1 ABC transporter permease [Antarctobacter heliothermus]MBY6146691.1 ABC transporter permease [Mameliella alba]MBY6163639.1 ABC transporter permease [Mameliella alba]MBY6172030.1 ABC transporter permease [Mameliella alba]
MSGNLSREALVKWAPLIVLLVLIAFFTVLEPRFFSVRNLARIAISSSPALMVAIGVTFIIIMGSIDLSMEGTVSVSAVVFAFAFIGLGGTVLGLGILALPLAILVGAAIGLINGLVHVKLKIPSFMASLAMGFVGTGFALLLTGGDRIRVEDEVFRGLLTERWFGFPVMVYVAGLFVLIAWFIQARTTLGRNFYAVGGGEELAHASGLNVNKVRVLGFMLAGMFYAVGALLAVGRIGIAETATGNNFMFMSITSVVVGGTALWGGIGGVWNTLVGVLIVNVIGNGMVVIGLPGYVQDGVLGALVIAAVVLSTDRKSIAFVK